MRTKILFLIHDLGQGGAEKVLVNLVNNMDNTMFDIHVTVLFGGGVNEQFLKPHIVFHKVWERSIPGNSKLMKLMTPQQLHKLCVKEEYDIEVSYLEGPSARIISGCENSKTKLICWIHVEQHTMDKVARAFRSKSEAIVCYNKFDQINCVSQFVKEDFCHILNYGKECTVIYNTVESDRILALAQESAPELQTEKKIKLIAVGTLKESKGYERLFRIIRRLKVEGYSLHLFVLGIGKLMDTLQNFIQENGLQDSITLLGYDTNPYKYVAKSDLFVCASFAEGFSTAATEALILGRPICTVDVSGMKEMLGDHNEYGVVTVNSEEDLYYGIKTLLDEPELLSHYASRAAYRGRLFETDSTVLQAERMFFDVLRKQ